MGAFREGVVLSPVHRLCPVLAKFRCPSLLPDAVRECARPRWVYPAESVRSVLHVMSTLSPTLTCSNTVGSTTRRLYFQPFGPSKEIDDALLSMATMLAV